jgi:hypothetical protein
MKSIFILLTVLASITNSYAADEPQVSKAAMASFQITFTTATDVKWSIGDNFFRADFELNGQYASAYFDEEGVLMATARNISSLQLPIALQASLKKEYGNYWVSELFEVSNEDGTQYYVTVENADTKLVLRSVTNEWKSYKKTSKA